MARIRTIKPEFFTSLTIDKLSLSAQRTFVGLWTYADDHGRGLDDARLIKAALWPLRSRHTPARVEQDMKEIESLNLISRYEIGGTRYFYIPTWYEHQRVNRPSTSKIPPPPAPDGSPRAHGAFSESSPQEGKGRELGKGKEEEHASLSEEQGQHPTRKFNPLCVDCGDRPWECPRCSHDRLAEARA